MRIPVVTAADGAEWETRLVLAWERDDAAFAVVRRCIDIVDLLAVATSGQAQIALVSAALRGLDADAVDRLKAAGVVVVCVVGRGETGAEDHLQAIGVHFVVPDDADTRVVASVVEAALADEREGDGPGRQFGDPATATSMVMPAPQPPPGGTPARRGSVVAVWGPAGAPGRTTIAVTLADELARFGCESLLIDADVYGGVAAVVLGLLDESPGIAAACRQASAARLDADALSSLCWQLEPRSRVLTGITRAQRWPELRGSAVESVLGAARGLADFTVVDCGFSLETDEELSYDTMAPRRNAATLTALESADLIIAVGSCDAVGLSRLVRGLFDLREAEFSAPIWVVLNRVRKTVVPGDPYREAASALERLAGRSPAALLPFDQDALDAALAVGKTLGGIRPKSPLRQAMVELASAVAGVSTQNARRWRRKAG